ncbi:MAG: hypothetical protein WA045_04290, partial [Nitrospira sp.]
MHLPVKDKPEVVKVQLAWRKYVPKQKGVGPVIAFSGLVATLVGLWVVSIQHDAEALTKQLEDDHTKYEKSVDQIQADIESRIPSRVRSPLPIFPENGQTLLLKPTIKRPITLEWADRDRAHHHKYIVQLVCIAAIQEQAGSRCSPGKLDEDTLKEDTENRANPDGASNYYWTLPGMDKYKVKIEQAGTYAWRVARGEVNQNGEITIFQEWSPYS